MVWFEMIGLEKLKKNLKNSFVYYLLLSMD